MLKVFLLVKQINTYLKEVKSKSACKKQDRKLSGIRYIFQNKAKKLTLPFHYPVSQKKGSFKSYNAIMLKGGQIYRIVNNKHLKPTPEV